ncbi:hypothetical protein [Thysanoplusia orichalcea nucleopolyhedrovirus]|uniref:RING-type domain-containing protein n=1 Tax=Thysanoplusia orichalcea nucleopolyhedrovirus TaxID=101850 RepID=L0CJX4_9ABAC|nr:hypothetical protein [Thysanoplusia orichalcea nucleopolyhedrovirus]AGA16197.1 hypothetical protein [Thysanoplusia orichalcea nucleopolyhedrovirus]
MSATRSFTCTKNRSLTCPLRPPLFINDAWPLLKTASCCAHVVAPISKSTTPIFQFTRTIAEFNNKMRAAADCVKTQALRNLVKPPLYDLGVDRHGCKVFTVRRYNRRVIDFAGIRNKTLEIIKSDRKLPLNTQCNVKAVDTACMLCKRNFTLYPAVTYLHCGHSCLCTDCDETANVDSTCRKCKSGIRYKLKYKSL